ncbi:MAG TPA: exodeoxyribonuclease VII small subunit [Thermoanaerobacterales bacterium]|nr:exodeoxyribonuclease VII small subunit [Thermoanaerobacterales bacterium]
MDKEDITFESALQQLEQIVELLEKGDLPMEEALKKFEKGVKLAQFCTNKINEIEGKISLLIEKDKGEFLLEEFEYIEEE